MFACFSLLFIDHCFLSFQCTTMHASNYCPAFILQYHLAIGKSFCIFHQFYSTSNDQFILLTISHVRQRREPQQRSGAAVTGSSNAHATCVTLLLCANRSLGGSFCSHSRSRDVEWCLSALLTGTRPIVTRTVKAPTVKPAPPTGNLQKLPVCDKCGNGIV